MNERPQEAALDAALTRIHATSPLWREALSNHAPMAAEALIELRRADAIDAFLESYGKNLEPAEPVPAERLDEWTAKLGDRSSMMVLIGHFAAAIAEEGVERVVDEALPVLFEGVLGSSLHGLLRLSHAWRGWRHRPSEPRVAEIAQALGYWAGEYRALDGEPGAAPEAGLTPAEALRRVPALPAERWVDGIITERALASAKYPAFLDAIRRVDFAAQTPAETVASLTGLAARLMLTTSSRRHRFAYLHAVTGTSALREVLPRLDERGQRDALRHHWHALAAIRCMSLVAQEGEEPSPSLPAPVAVDREELVRVAVASRDDHAIKITAAVLTELQHHDDPYLPMAAWAYASAASA